MYDTRRCRGPDWVQVYPRLSPRDTAAASGASSKLGFGPSCRLRRLLNSSLCTHFTCHGQPVKHKDQVEQMFVIKYGHPFMIITCPDKWMSTGLGCLCSVSLQSMIFLYARCTLTHPASFLSVFLIYRPSFQVFPCSSNERRVNGKDGMQDKHEYRSLLLK